MEKESRNEMDLPYSDLKARKEASLERVLSKIASKYDVSEVKGIQMECPQCGHEPGLHKCCPQCRVMANDPATIELLFGYRRMNSEDNFVLPQARCYSCR